MKFFEVTLPTIVLAMVQIHQVDAFANQKGWKARPVVPKLAKSPEEEQSKTNAGKKREKWDALRFISQSSRFVSLPKPPLPIPGITKNPVKVNPGDVLWSTDNKNDFTFAPLDDVVMGGVSSSTFSPATGKWTGFVSDSNSGGFVGIRSTPFASALDMSNCQGVEMTFKGSRDKVFKAVIRDSTDFNGVCWTSTFGGTSEKAGFFAKMGKDEDSSYTVKIAFDKLVPTIFARTVPGQTLNKRTIEGFQLAYSKFLFDGELNPNFSLGDFSLDMVEVKAY